MSRSWQGDSGPRPGPCAYPALFGSRRSYIYFLEILSQAVCLLTNSASLNAFWVSFCDNRAGLSALRKGYGKDEAISRLLPWFHAMCLRKRWHGHFAWVSSHANLSDKVSRGDLRLVQARGWPLLQSDLGPLWQIIGHIAADSTYAVSGISCGVLSLSWQFTGSTWVGREAAELVNGSDRRHHSAPPVSAVRLLRCTHQRRMGNGDKSETLPISLHRLA